MVDFPYGTDILATLNRRGRGSKSHAPNSHLHLHSAVGSQRLGVTSRGA